MHNYLKQKKTYTKALMLCLFEYLIYLTVSELEKNSTLGTQRIINPTLAKNNYVVF